MPTASTNSSTTAAAVNAPASSATAAPAPDKALERQAKMLVQLLIRRVLITT